MNLFRGANGEYVPGKSEPVSELSGCREKGVRRRTAVTGAGERDSSPPGERDGRRGAKGDNRREGVAESNCRPTCEREAGIPGC